MSTVVYQGLQSHLESQLMESRTLKLKLCSHKTVIFQSLELALQSSYVPADLSNKLESSISPDLRGGSSPQNLPSITSEIPREKLKAPYVHPYAKSASWWLSEKSLNLCTENLGSETGSEFIENSIFSSQACSAPENNNNEIQVNRGLRQPRIRQVSKPKNQFPPPLTILNGPDCLDIRPQREDGRLILKAIKSTPARRSCFLVDRSSGRLRLSLSDSQMNTCKLEKEGNKVSSDQIVTNDKTDKDEKNGPELAACSSYVEETIRIGVQRVEMNQLLDQKRRGTSSNSCYRCNATVGSFILAIN